MYNSSSFWAGLGGLTHSCVNQAGGSLAKNLRHRTHTRSPTHDPTPVSSCHEGIGKLLWRQEAGEVRDSARVVTARWRRWHGNPISVQVPPFWHLVVWRCCCVGVAQPVALLVSERPPVSPSAVLCRRFSAAAVTDTRARDAPTARGVEEERSW
jgi:hypothetical protein